MVEEVARHKRIIMKNHTGDNVVIDRTLTPERKAASLHSREQTLTVTGLNIKTVEQRLLQRLQELCQKADMGHLLEQGLPPELLSDSFMG